MRKQLVAGARVASPIHILGHSGRSRDAVRALMPLLCLCLLLAPACCAFAAENAAPGGAQVQPQASPVPSTPAAAPTAPAVEPAAPIETTPAQPTLTPEITPTQATAAPAAPAAAPTAPAVVPTAPIETIPVQPTLTPEITPTQATAAPEVKPTAPAVKPAALPIPIVDIQIAGAEHVQTEDIRAAITSKVGGFYTEEQLARDREAVLRLGWFQTVAAEREVVENGVRLIFRVRENPVIKDIQFHGISVLARDQLLAVMRTKPGSIYNIQLLGLDGQAIEELYRSNGYSLAFVLDQSITDEGVLILDIAEGVIESIRITGNTYTKTYVVQRYVHAKPGEIYNAKKVQADVARLTQSGWFDSVRTDAEVGEQPGKVILIFVIVEKQRTGQAVFGGAYTSVQGIIGFVDLSKTNLKGSGQSLSLRGEFGGERSYELGYRNPWIMSPETRMNLGIYDRFVLREAFVTTPDGANHDILYRERRTGGNVLLGRPVSDHTTYYVGLRRDDVALSDVALADQPYLTGVAFQPSEVRSLSLSSITDTRDNQNSPVGGAYHQFATEFAGIFGGSKFNKYTTDNRRYFRAGTRTGLPKVFAVRLIAGSVTGSAPYLEQFLIGGPDSLRGYRVDRFAGSHMVVLNTEYRFPLTKNLVGVGFVDAGDAWGGTIASDPYFESDKTFRMRLGYGVGVRVQTPVGPLRLDLGFSREGAQTEFGVAQMF